MILQLQRKFSKFLIHEYKHQFTNLKYIIEYAKQLCPQVQNEPTDSLVSKITSLTHKIAFSLYEPPFYASDFATTLTCMISDVLEPSTSYCAKKKQGQLYRCTKRLLEDSKLQTTLKELARTSVSQIRDVIALDFPRVVKLWLELNYWQDLYNYTGYYFPLELSFWLQVRIAKLLQDIDVEVVVCHDFVRTGKFIKPPRIVLVDNCEPPTKTVANFLELIKLYIV